MARRVLISGASIAGPALAFWLGRMGYDVVVIEQAPALREGGYSVDFRGAAHFGVLGKMASLLPHLKSLETGGGAMRFIDQRGRTTMYLPTEFAGGELEVRRADISREIVKQTTGQVVYRFGESLTSIDQSGDTVRVHFESGASDSFDFVFGCDGIHSNVRRLAFGDQSFERFLGYYIASWDVLGHDAPRDESVLCNAPGRMIGVTPPGRDGSPAGVMAIFKSSELPYSRRDVIRHKDTLRRVFGKMKWRVPELLETLERTDDVFVNTISRATVPNWSMGRVALAGDAAGGTSIGGMGTGTAIVGAYILAGELSSTPDDFVGAFARYQSRVEPYAAACSKNGETSGNFLAPGSAMSLFLRNVMFSVPAIKSWMIRLANESGADIDLPSYVRLTEHAGDDVSPRSRPAETNMRS
jgi:2-polyprenyl-6-methoxyphenol hydroxylase-like FAD-dependent oxidoreductase